MSLRDDLIKAGIIKPAGCKQQESKQITPKDVIGNVLPTDLPKPEKKPAKKPSTPNRESRKLAKIMAKYPRSTVPVVCPLCGEKVPGGTLLQHKHDAHGESIVAHTARRTAPMYQETATFVRGGGTGLKK